MELLLENDVQTRQAGARLATCLQELQQGAVVYLQGDLGAGKTTFSQGLIASLGHSGPVKSPTYTLVEPYEISGRKVLHFDLYRLGDPEELEFLGVRDYFQSENICLIEWPIKGEGYLAKPDIVVELQAVPGGRQMTLAGVSAFGNKVLARYRQANV